MPLPIARRLLPALLVLPLAQGQAASRAALEAVHDVRIRIEARNCGAAVEQLKAGLKAGHPELALLAGSMYEHGICVKANWDNAVTFYVQAHQGGLPEAAERLAAGYADPARGPDAAAALWWSLRGRSGMRSGTCAVPEEVEQDPDRFVAELKTWDPSRLAICNYIIGVLWTIAAEVKYPAQAQAWGLHGDVTLRFLPGLARIEVKKGETGAYQLYGVIDGDVLRDRESIPARGGFEKMMREVADRALRRYPQPPGIPADTSVSVKYVFSLE
ncbi:hypothetical protein [Massilia sp. 9I]|uniref:hypothetical protein n=1 Tax=Massilia sp. 9I TaxID=2653152 RepID=UPI0012F02F47|nr:hypothetical protein [Massilia sp. 9I]VXC32270.1 conserved exported hypothetical protein [Massilia sp. 9I]